MEKQNLRRNITFLLPDQQQTASGVCVTQLTRTYSDSSAITVNDKSGPSTVWTDEKHSLYLASLEASFINKLYHSIELRGTSQEILWEPYSSPALLTSSCNASNKLMVLREQNINYKRNKHVLESTADSHFVQEPWISHFSSTGKRQNMACDVRQHGGDYNEKVRAGVVCCGSARSSEQHPARRLCYRNSVGLALENSDQNFVDEDKGEKSRCMTTAKRLKIVAA
ncbi:cold-regulated protein 27-like [Mercurialis annua]|uniref:cold-regulated protein 27-like n=1 Tax=Mercurialis annua TaxID=3986 RepID=UPI00215E307F|nr:cold-regulated protein 27-like [Mercurialis annua]